MADVMVSKSVAPIKANKITMAIFIKLLATKIVANSFFGRSKRYDIISICLDFASKPVSISVLVKENKATSAPEINAEQNSNTNKSKKLLANEKSIAINNGIKLAGSGSKFNHFS